jgi:hypothetical protein
MAPDIEFSSIFMRNALNKMWSQAQSPPATVELGDIVWNTAPTADGVLLWVCVSTTPVTYKAVSIST